MRTTAFLLLAFTAASAAVAQEKKTIEGNGKIITRDVSVSSFDALTAKGVYELKLRQGSKESVQIEADENLHDLFQVRNEGSRLVIDMKKMNDVNLKSKSKMRVYVTFKKLKEIDLATVGNVSSESRLSFDDLDMTTRSVGQISLDLTANKLNLENRSVGNVTLQGKAQDAVVRNSGVGSLEAGDFVVQTMNIQNSGVGNTEVNAAKNLQVDDNDLGKVHNKGTAPAVKKNKVRL